MDVKFVKGLSKYIISSLIVIFLCWFARQFYTLSQDVSILKSNMSDYPFLRNKLNYIMGALNEKGFHINIAMLEMSAQKGISTDAYLRANKLIDSQPAQAKTYLTNTLGFSNSEAAEVIESVYPSVMPASSHGNYPTNHP